MKQEKNSIVGTIFILLFTQLFGAGGIYMGYTAASTIYHYWEASSWEEVPALIEVAELEDKGGDSRSSLVKAEYTYSYKGNSYRSDQTTFYTADSIGRYHQDRHSDLTRSFRRAKRESLHLKDPSRKVYRVTPYPGVKHKPFNCYVNPSNPEESILFRDLRPKLLLFCLMFILTFGGVGVGGLFVTYRSITHKVQESRFSATELAAKPWLKNDEWAME